MATLHQDSGKENPLIQKKEKTLNSKSNILQPTALSVPSAANVGGVNKLQAQERSGFAMLNKNTNINTGNVPRYTAAGGSKVQSFIGGKKPMTAVPAFEQFKAFSVYEDKVEATASKAAKDQQHQYNVIDSISSVIEKENICSDECNDENQRFQRIEIDLKSNTTLHKEFGNDDDFLLDATPMSVSDVLSPMSVDRSHLSNSVAHLFDDSNSKIIADKSTEQTSKTDESPLPRNDRERFFEVVPYQRSILEYFRENEKKHRPKPHYMRRQSDINYSMRTILVDWLVEVSEEYNLDTETLYLAVSYIDRFLSQMSVVRSKLQLVGTAAIYIASKYEEIYPPDVGEFVFVTDDTYNKSQVLRMEQIILKILTFDLTTPTANVFVNMYAVLDNLPEKVKYLAKYLSELSLLEADPYLRFYPSVISSATVALARYILDYPIWSSELEEITSYKLEDLKEVVLNICKSHNAASNLSQQAIQEKYKAEKYKQVSTISPVEITEAMFNDILQSYNNVTQMESIKGNSNYN